MHVCMQALEALEVEDGAHEDPSGVCASAGRGLWFAPACVTPHAWLLPATSQRCLLHQCVPEEQGADGAPPLALACMREVTIEDVKADIELALGAEEGSSSGGGSGGGSGSGGAAGGRSEQAGLQR